MFFKWIKQHLKVKKFLGTSGNAVCVKTYCTIITYNKVTIAQHNKNWTQRLCWSPNSLNLPNRQNTSQWLVWQINFKNIKDKYDSSEPNLFNLCRLFLSFVTIFITIIWDCTLLTQAAEREQSPFRHLSLNKKM